MGRSLDQVLGTLSPKRRERIEAGAQELLKEYDTLMEFRKAVGLTQVQLAEKMNITQVNVSKLERRKDMHLSTLRRYVEALGGELEVTIKMPVKGKDNGEAGYTRLTLP